MRQKGSRLWYLLVGAVMAGTAYYLGASNTTDFPVAAPVEAPSFPKLQSDSLPKRPIVAPNEPFASGWSEPSPAEAVAQEAERTRRRIEEDQQREMMQNMAAPEPPVAPSGAP
jgi:hypothetical protein